MRIYKYTIFIKVNAFKLNQFDFFLINAIFFLLTHIAFFFLTSLYCFFFCSHILQFLASLKTHIAILSPRLIAKTVSPYQVKYKASFDGARPYLTREIGSFPALSGNLKKKGSFRYVLKLYLWYCLFFLVFR